LSITGSRSRTAPEATPGALAIGSIGVMSGVSARYIRTFGANASTRVSAGFDWRRTNNDLLFGGERVFTSSADVAQIVGEVSKTLAHGPATTSLGATAVFSPGGLGARNSDAAFDVQRAGATARYAYVRGTVEELIALPRRFGWDVRASGQFAGAQLLSSEQMAFGGDGSVRGLPTFAATRDNGLIVSTELRTPGMPVFARSADPARQDRLSLFAFVDGAGGGQHAINAPRLRLASAGPGLRYQFGRYASLTLAYGRVLHQEGVLDAGRGRVHFLTQITF
jgi:hemolysin activation/secretion protein